MLDFESPIQVHRPTRPKTAAIIRSGRASLGLMSASRVYWMAGTGGKCATELMVMHSNQRLSHPRCRKAIAMTALALGLLGPDVVAIGQDQSAATAKDVIWARKILMASVGDDADQIRFMISDRDIDLQRAREYGRNISAMLTAFPHLFPPVSNQWKEGADLDPVTDTIASPDIWTDFADFYKQATGAARIADEMSRATDEEEVKSLHRALEINCDLCHSLYLKE